jgi:D-alanine-D-alanine ligase-like ATP-grasp enzyme
MPIDFADPAFFNVMRATKGHTASAYLVTLAALTQGLDVTFFRNQREAELKNPLFSDAVSEPIFYRVSNGRRAHFFSGSQSDRTSATAAFTTRDKLKTKALLHAKNLNTPAGGLMSAKDHSLLGRMHQAGVKWFVIKPVAGSLGKGVFLHQSAAQVLQYLQANPKESFLVEQHIEGFENRVFVVDGVAVSSYRVIPNHVVGNGTDSIWTLFAARQDQRQRNPFLVERPADMASVEMTLLARGLTWSNVPTRGQRVWLASNGVPTTQSDFLLSLDTLPDAAKRLAVAATKAVAAYNAALDMIVEPSGEAYVLEMNIRAMIAPASFPHPVGPYNLTVPAALIQSLFAPPKSEPRPLLGFDFQSLGAEVFREDRTSSGVKAADFAQFG